MILIAIAHIIIITFLIRVYTWKIISGKSIHTSCCYDDHSIFHSLLFVGHPSPFPNLWLQNPRVLQRHLVLLQPSSGSTRASHRSKLLALSKILHSDAALIQSRMAFRWALQGSHWWPCLWLMEGLRQGICRIFLLHARSPWRGSVCSSRQCGESLSIQSYMKML